MQSYNIWLIVHNQNDPNGLVLAEVNNLFHFFFEFFLYTHFEA